MIFPLLQFFASKFLLLALHLEAGSFPRPLTAKEEIETFAALRAGDSTARENSSGTICAWWLTSPKNITPSLAIRMISSPSVPLA